MKQFNVQQLQAIQRNYKNKNNQLKINKMIRPIIKEEKIKQNHRIKSLEYQNQRYSQKKVLQNRAQKVNSLKRISRVGTDQRIDQIKKKYHFCYNGTSKNKLKQPNIEIKLSMQQSEGCQSILRQRQILSLFNSGNNHNETDKVQYKPGSKQKKYKSQQNFRQNKQNKFSSCTHPMQIYQQSINKLRSNTHQSQRNNLPQNAQIRISKQLKHINEYACKQNQSNQKANIESSQYFPDEKTKNNWKYSINRQFNKRIQNIDNINSKIKLALQKLDNCVFPQTKMTQIVKINIQPFKRQNAEQQKYKKQYLQQKQLKNIEIKLRNDFKRRSKTMTDNFYNQKNDNPLNTLENQLIMQTNQQYKNLFIQQKSDQKSQTGRITFIKDKIKQLQKQKEQLNIQFQPFSYVKLQRRSLNKNSSQQKRKSFTVDKIYQFDQNKDKYRDKVSYRSTVTDFNGEHSLQHSNITVVKNKITSIKGKFGLVNLSEEALKDIKCNQQLDQINIDQKKFKHSSKQEQNQRTNWSKKDKKTINQLAKRQYFLKETIVKNERAFQKFKSLIMSQIPLDQNLRKGKFWFKNLKDSQKWMILKEILLNKINLQCEVYNYNQNQIKIQKQTIQKLKTISLRCQFQISEQQTDPFYSDRQVNCTYEDLISQYIKCQKNWQKIVKSNIIQQLFENEWIQILDIQKKGHANLSDFARFMNYNNNFCHRNRDFILIFRRIFKIFSQTYLKQKHSHNIIINNQSLILKK